MPRGSWCQCLLCLQSTWLRSLTELCSVDRRMESEESGDEEGKKQSGLLVTELSEHSLKDGGEPGDEDPEGTVTHTIPRSALIIPTHPPIHAQIPTLTPAVRPPTHTPKSLPFSDLHTCTLIPALRPAHTHSYTHTSTHIHTQTSTIHSY